MTLMAAHHLKIPYILFENEKAWIIEIRCVEMKNIVSPILFKMT